ncbi:Acetyltransferase (GNAT) family protein [Actinopolyspora xinjiangensis]|uniref:Acetyltransferase (GNAT) family protein n=1 Tax=Actinopolyspora xinjiangensis TaxID=405564 RepID=A0A1H0WZH6_9ACTN|nr:GNAT family N-acetyltransferase [Actinopolyspora xinjiangensis]SDP95636.1 Acetyltransferase (GNAT) family protein [Actinopolyspora xinjiangensis]
MSHEIKVQPIEPGQLDGLLELCREHAAYEGAEFHENGQVERWRSALFEGRPSLHGWMALDCGKPCGFMTVTTDFATWSAERFAYMDCLFLRDGYRGMGIGRMFLDRLREFSAAEGCGWAEWQTPTDNELGIGFYRRMGAEAKHKIRFHYDVGMRGVS